ncbi:maleylacetoacetate isomerase [Asticcacaulis machinosus]|uniref:Maleylacetoacetate isomerase n=1 Tax=Asticcacaulis machinosus TaxID=2984211 RepID=A0ABT5HK03_9CAUL|nr:maleylacetoacetate isomerase [Asticcacaulis machinosus]MDC7676566.1 maleylacetoacetate isomerase [Asticcacaulis machinosus]
MTTLTLHGYWRSGAAYRVRIALNLKGLEYDQVSHDLRTGAQSAADYKAIAPQGLVPALQYGDLTLTQSPAILEWLEETFPQPPLIPTEADARAIVRAMAALIGCDIHPLNNLRVLKRLKKLGHDQSQIDDWARHWITTGFDALETMVAQHGRGFCFGSTATFADCYLIPQLYSARRFGADLALYPRLLAVEARASEYEAFRLAHPSVQPDADPAGN